MIVAKEIIEIDSFSITCKFTNGEVWLINVGKLFANKTDDIYAQKILNKSIFDSVKIGEMGQFYWENVAQMKDYGGQTIPCEYDMSPEFVYHNSTPTNQASY